jgi:hypothetical protein
MIARPQTDHRRHARRVTHATPPVCLNASTERMGNGDVPLQSVTCAAYPSTVPSTCGRPGHSCISASGL